MIKRNKNEAGWSVYVPINGNYFGQSSLFAIKIFFICSAILAGGARRSCVSSEDWHPLQDRLLNQTAPIKYALSTIQTLFAEFDR